jgi:hypothetical protein
MCDLHSFTLLSASLIQKFDFCVRFNIWIFVVQLSCFDLATVNCLHPDFYLFCLDLRREEEEGLGSKKSEPSSWQLGVP